MIYIASGVWVDVGDWVWGRVYIGDGNKPKLIRGEILSIGCDVYTSSVDIQTKKGKTYCLPPNLLHVTKPKAIIVEDELGKLTVWEG